MNNTVKAEAVTSTKRPYVEPELKQYGAFRELTQNGSVAGTEGRIANAGCTNDARKPCL